VRLSCWCGPLISTAEGGGRGQLGVKTVASEYIQSLNLDTMRLGSARASGVPLLGPTVRVRTEMDEFFILNMAETNTTSTTNERNKKRKSNDPVSLSDSDDNTNSITFARFLIVEPASEQPINLNIFGIQKLLQCAVGTVVSAKKLRSGAVLIQVANKTQSDRALSMTVWIDTPVKVSPHRSLNSCQGVIRCREFRDCADDEVLEALQPEGVTSVKHIMSKKTGTAQPTNTFILTFGTPTPPKFVKAAYMCIQVDPYIPNPLRCYQCQKYGHGKNNCKHAAVCAKCGQTGHTDSDCQATPHCVNCSGAHPAYSRDCPHWQFQREVSTVKFTQNVSFAEAKEIVRQRNPAQSSSRPTFANVISNKKLQMRSIEVQTEFTWPGDCKFPLPVAKLPVSESTECQTEEDDNSVIGAIGGAPAHRSDLGHNVLINSGAKPKVTLQTSVRQPAGQNKPGPASSKTTTNQPTKQSKPSLSNRQSKGSLDPLKQFNRYGSLNDDDNGMDILESNHSPGKGASRSPKHTNK
jgi:hypothetical protein